MPDDNNRLSDLWHSTLIDEVVSLQDRVRLLEGQIAAAIHALAVPAAEYVPAMGDALHILNDGVSREIRERWRAAQRVADTCAEGFPQAAYNDGKYLPPDVRDAVREYLAVTRQDGGQTDA